jgi:biopolymer transport protein ExbD
MKKIIILLLITCLFAMPIMAQESQVEIPKQETKTLANDPFMVVWFFIAGFVFSKIAKDVIVDGAYGVRK